MRTTLLVCLLLAVAVSAELVHLPVFRTAVHPRQLHLVPHELRPETRYARFAQASNATVESFGMGGNILPVGIYWTTVSLGTPPQTFKVAVDTGSTDLLVPSSNCQGCHTQNTGVFNPTSSSTNKKVACVNSLKVICRACSASVCTFVNSYETCNLTAPQQSCTVTGPIMQDQFSMGTLGTEVVFGLIQQQTTNFQQFFVIDGLIGFSFVGSSSFNSPSAFERVTQAGETQWVFSMCMNSSMGGVITLGGYDQKYYTGEIQWSPQTAYGSHYALSFQGASVGSRTATITATDNMIIDSGTNVLLLRSNSFKGIQAAFIAELCPASSLPGFCDSGNPIFAGNCYAYTSAQLSQLPVFTMEMKGAKLQLTGEQYMVRNSTDTNIYCFGIKNTGPLGLNIIGDVVMQQYYAIFDNVNRRIGWADVVASNCIGVPL